VLSADSLQEKAKGGFDEYVMTTGKRSKRFHSLIVDFESHVVVDV
jgi:hypothetical protein